MTNNEQLEINGTKMKSNLLLYGMAAVLLTMFAGCVHEYPSADGGVDPTLVNVDADLSFTLGWEEHGDVNVRSTRTVPDGFERRFVVELYRRGEESVPLLREVMLPGGDYADGTFTLPRTLQLHALRYTVAVWADYVKADASGADLYYDTHSLSGVACTDPYTGATDLRAAYYATAELDLSDCRDKWNAHRTLRLDMQRPQGRLRILATDLRRYLDRQRAEAEAAAAAGTKAPQVADGPYSIRFSYSYFVPTTFNLLTGKPTDARPGIAFSHTVTLPDDAGTDAFELGSDYVFVNGAETTVVLNVEICDAAGKLIGTTKGINIPCRRGCITTVRGDFFTAKSQSGITVDTEFEGDMDVWI